MPRFGFEGQRPDVDPACFIARTDVLVGDVTSRERACVWYTAVLLGEPNSIVVRAGANVQDCSVVHVTARAGVEIGRGATVGHNCTIHAAWLGEEALVGNGSTVLDGARIGVRAMIAGGALVTPETEVPDGMLAMGTPAKVKGPLAGTPAEFWVKANPQGYQKLAQRHLAGIAEVPR